MAQDSKIEWTKHTANLWHGCTKAIRDSEFDKFIRDSNKPPPKPPEILFEESNRYKKGCATDMPAQWHNIAINAMEVYADEKIMQARIIVAKATNGTEVGKKLDEELYKLLER